MIMGVSPRAHMIDMLPSPLLHASCWCSTSLARLTASADLEREAMEPWHADKAVPLPLLLQACWSSSRCLNSQAAPADWESKTS